MSDNTWTIIGDHEHASFGKGTIAFQRSDDQVAYLVSYDDDDQHRINITIGDVVLTMDIFTKNVSPAGTIAIAGMITERDDSFGIGGAAWGELVFSRPPAFHFYGNGILMRTDAILTKP